MCTIIGLQTRVGLWHATREIGTRTIWPIKLFSYIHVLWLPLLLLLGTIIIIIHDMLWFDSYYTCRVFMREHISTFVLLPCRVYCSLFINFSRWLWKHFNDYTIISYSKFEQNFNYGKIKNDGHFFFSSSQKCTSISLFFF